MGTKVHIVPGNESYGIFRGGGSERIDWASNGPMRLVRDIIVYDVIPSRRVVDVNAFVPAPALPSGSADTDNTVRSKGDAAIGMARPASPSVNILTSAGELAQDGLPTPPDLLRWRSSVKDLIQLGRDGARDYVAYNFAWKPLEREIRQYYRQVAKSDQIVRDANRNLNRRLIRVGHEYPANSTTTSSLGSIIGGNWKTTGTLGAIGSGGTVLTTMSRVWYEGKYLYYFPLPKDAVEANRGYADEARSVLGLRLSPEVLWNLAPWSWFADWISNTDTIMGSISGALSDGMVPVEGWVMHHYQKTAHSFQMGSTTRYTAGGTKRTYETKLRFVSAPYIGFGGVGTLSAKQLSILAALGVKH